MSEEASGAFATAGVFGIVAIAFTLLFGLMAYMDQINAAMESVPEIYYYVFYALWVGVSLLAMAFGSGGVKEAGSVGFVVIFFASGMTLAFTAPKYIAPILEANLPVWPSWMWLGVGIGIGAVLLGTGFLGPPILARLKGVENEG